MKNKRKILLVSGIGIVIMAIAIGVTIAVSRPGTMKNSRQATSGQTTESKEKDNELPVLPIGTDTPQSGDDTSIAQSDTGTHGKKASREQAESNGKKNDSKSPDQKNTTGYRVVSWFGDRSGWKSLSVYGKKRNRKIHAYKTLEGVFRQQGGYDQ